MEIQNFTITKREGKRYLFSSDKIDSAINKALNSVCSLSNMESLPKILDHIDLNTDIEVVDNSINEGSEQMIDCHGSAVKYIGLIIEPSEYGRGLLQSLPIFRGKRRNKIKDKLYTENSNSEKKQILKKALENISDNTSKEDIIKEIEQVVEDNNIDRRVFNGRDEEHDFCESLTNDQVWDVFVKCYNGVLKVSQTLCKYMQAFAIALYEVVGKRDLFFDGKVSFIHRFAESKLGRCLSFGVRAVQKGIAKFKQYRQIGSTLDNDLWEAKEKERNASFAELIENIKLALTSALVSAN